MKRDEPHGRDDADGLKERPLKCYARRSTEEQRKSPHAEKVPLRYGVKDRSSEPCPSTTTEQRGNNEVGNQKVIIANEVGGESSNTSIREVLAAEKLKDSSVEGVVRANKKFLDPAVASPLHVKPPPPVLSEEQEVYCSPANESTWKGNFEIVNFPYKNEGFVAHPAAKISAKAYGLACKMAGNLRFEMHHRDSFIPEAFKTYCDAGDIALYFYPQNRSESSNQEYTALLKHLTKHRQMLRSEMGQVELLVFSSVLLCPTSQKDRGHHFMWGVFRKIWSDDDICISGVSPTPNLGPKNKSFL